MKLFAALSILLLLNTVSFSQKFGNAIKTNFHGSCTYGTDAVFAKNRGLLDDASTRLGSLTEFFLKIDFIQPSASNTILNDENPNKFRLYISQSGHLCLEGKEYDGPLYTVDAGAISIGQWHHIALKMLPPGDNPFYFRFDIYVDGSLRSNFVLHPAYVGIIPSIWNLGDMYNEHGSFAGEMDEFRVTEFTDDCTVSVPTAPYSTAVDIPALFHFDTDVQFFEQDIPYIGAYTLGTDRTADDFDPRVVTSTAPISGAGKCLKFGKTGFVVNTNLNAAIGANRTFSVEMWVYWGGANGSNQTLWQYGGDDNAGFKVYINPSNVLCVSLPGTTGLLETRNGIQANSWTHIALISGGPRFTVFVNGTPVYGWFYSNPQMLTPANLKFLIGSNYDFTQRFNGQVDEFRLIDGMSPYDGNSIFTPQATPFVPVPGYAGILYHFDEGSGQTVINSSHPDMNGYYGSSTGTDWLDPVFVGEILPVELSSFKAEATGSSISLKWTTATEVNNYGFEVERKNTEWETIGFVKGNGNSNSPREYSFVDKSSLTGKLQYRLKQMDNDGAYKYYDAVAIEVTGPAEYKLLQNSPNPFNPVTAIKFQIPAKVRVSIKVYNLLGSEVATLADEEKTAGSHIVYWNGRDSRGQMVSSGVYLYKLTAGNYMETRKMSLLK